MEFNSHLIVLLSFGCFIVSVDCPVFLLKEILWLNGVDKFRFVQIIWYLEYFLFSNNYHKNVKYFNIQLFLNTLSFNSWHSSTFLRLCNDKNSFGFTSITFNVNSFYVCLISCHSLDSYLIATRLLLFFFCCLIHVRDKKFIQYS